MVLVSKGSVEELLVMCEEQKVIHVMTMYCVTGIGMGERIC